MSLEPKAAQAIRTIERMAIRGVITKALAEQMVALVRAEHYQNAYGPVLATDPVPVVADTSSWYMPAVSLRMSSTRAAIRAALELLDQVATLGDVSPLYQYRAGQVRLYTTMSRRFPLTGGVK